MSDPIVGISADNPQYTGPGTITKEQLAPKMVGIDDPNYSGPIGMERQVEQQYARIKEIADTMENPEQEMENILAADYIAQRFEKPTGHVYRNLDAYSQAYFQTPDVPKTPWKAATDEFERSWLSVQASQKGLEMMLNPYDETLYEEYSTILSQMPAPDGADRNIFEKTLKSSASILPSVGYVLANGLTTGAAGAAIGGIAGYALGGAPGATAGAAKGYDWGAKIGATKESFTLAAGGIFSEVMMVDVPDTDMKLYEIMMQSEGEDRNKILNIARAASITGGTLSAAIEYLSGTYSRLTGTTASFADDVADKVIRQILKDGYATKAVSKALLKYGLNAGTEATQEIAQEMIEKGAVEAAKYFANEAEKLGIPYAELSEWGNEAKEVGMQTFLGMLGIGLPGAVVSTYRDGAQAITQKKSMIPEGYRTTDTSSAASIEDIVPGEFTEEEYAQAQAVAEDSKTKAPIRVYRDQDGDLVAEDAAALQVAMDNGETAVEVEVVEEPVTPAQAEAKAKPAWAMKSDEYARTRQEQIKTVDEFKAANTLEDFKYNISKAFENITTEEQEGLAWLMELGAAVNDMGTDEYIQNTFAPEMFTQGRLPNSKKAGVQFQEDGRAMIHLTKNSDFSSFIHEYGHIVRRQLPQADQEILLKHFAKEDWTIEAGDDVWNSAEERFARAFETYFHTGKAPNAELKGLFQRIANALRKVYGAIMKAGYELEAPVRDVLDRFFTTQHEPAAADNSTFAAQENKLFQPAGDINSPEFKKWFEGSKVVDENGEPIVMYHGTTHDFEAFDPSITNPESDMGRGIYMSSELDDVESNYEGQGPDLTQRIELRAEQLENELEGTDEWEEVEDMGVYESLFDYALEKAEKELYGGADRVIEGYVALKDPVIIGEPHSIQEERETFLDYEEEYDEETEDYTGEVEGVLAEFVESLRELAWEDFEEFDAETVISDIMENAYDGGIGAKDLIGVMKASEGLMYATDENGVSMSSEIIRQAFENTGFDGIMDFTVNEKFGSQRQTGKSMQGMYEDTFHIIAFDSRQVKSVENQGSWDTSDPRILFQPEESQEFREWFKESKAVDSQGRPLTLYHGSPDARGIMGDEGRFMSEAERFGGFGHETHAHWFTPSYQTANSYADDHRAFDYQNAEAAVIPVFLSLQNPLIVDGAGKNWREAQQRGKTSDVIQEARESGHDGVIIRNVKDDYNNTARTKATDTYVVFSPEQIKSVDNYGEWNPTDPRILHQPNEHEEIIRTAVEEFKPVPADVLEEYVDRPWAAHELKRREVLKDYAWLEDMADTEYDEETGREGWEVFRDDLKGFATAMMAPEEVEAIEALGGAEDRFYKEIWSRANLSTREERNANFVKTYANADGVKSIAMELVTDIKKWSGRSVPDSIRKVANKLKYNGSLTDKLIDNAVAAIKADPTRMRRALAGAQGDDMEMMQLSYEDEIEEATPYKVKVQRMSEDERMKLYAKTEDLELRKILLKGIGSDQDTLEKMDKAVTAKIGTLKAELTKEKKEMAEKLAREERRVDNLRDLLKRKQQEYEEATEEAKAEKVAEIEELKKKQKSKLKEIRTKRDKKIKKIKAEIQERQDKRKELLRVKALSRRLAKTITKKPAKTCHVDWKKKILEFQEQIGMDPNYRRKSTLEEFARVRTRVLAGEEHGYAEDYVRTAFSKPLNEWTLPELEQINEKMNALRREGREAYTDEIELRRAEKQRDINNILLEVLEHDPIGSIYAEGSKEREEEKRTRLKTAIDIGTLTPSRLLADMAGDKSRMMELFDDGINAATDDELVRTRSRQETMKEIRKELGITETSLAQDITGPQGSLTVDQVIHIWTVRDNIDNMKAIIHGNGIKTPSKYTDQLTSEQKAYGDALRQDFENHREEYSEAIGKYTHGIMGIVDSGYFPMFRRGKVGESHPSQLLREVINTAAVSKAYPSKDRSKSRIKISDEHQAPIELGATTVWSKGMAENEHFIAWGDKIRHLQAIVDDAYFQKGITEKYGTKMVQWFKKYVNDIENPHLYDTYDGLSQLSKTLRRNRAMAFLAGNMMTVLKQFGSFSTYFRDVPPHLMIASAAKYGANHAEIEKFVKERDPQMMDRVMERELEELRLAKEHPALKILQKGTGVMMKAISWMDKNTVMIGWKAAYDYRISKGDSEAEAIRYAQKATLETQPAARAKDLAQVYRSQEGFNWFLMFTNQLNKNWNILWSDIPRAVRNMQLGKALAAFSGLLVSIYAISLATGWQPWEEEDLEGFMKSLGFQTMKGFAGFVPFVGGAVSSALNGWSNGGVDPFPFAAPAGHVLREVTEGDWEGALGMADDLAEGAGTMLGLPIVFLNRGADAIKELGEEEYMAAIAEFIGYHGEND